MGAGKTTVGKQLARHLALDFIDADRELEARCGVSIPTIFELEGEEGFRDRESQVLADLVNTPGLILATGGGVVMRAENRVLLAAHPCVVYLRAAVHDLWLRTRHDRNRPLLQTADPKARLRELYELRDPLYREVARHVVDTGRQPVSAVVNAILLQTAPPDSPVALD